MLKIAHRNRVVNHLCNCIKQHDANLAGALSENLATATKREGRMKEGEAGELGTANKALKLMSVKHTHTTPTPSAECGTFLSPAR